MRKLDEKEAASALETAEETKIFGFRNLWPLQDKPWQHTAHALGYLAPPSSESLPIRHAGNIQADISLKNSRIKITLDCLRVAAYPGGGTHRILFDFYV